MAKAAKKETKVDISKRYSTGKGVLRAVLALFEESPSNWTRDMKRRERKTANGGVAFCALGGIEHFAGDRVACVRARSQLTEALGGKCIPEVNDKRGRKAILAGLRKAVA